MDDLTTSQLGRQLFEQYLAGVEIREQTVSAVPELEAVLAKHLRALDKNFSRLMARSALDISSVRVLVMYLLNGRVLESEADVRALAEQAHQSARKRMHAPIESLEEMLTALRSEGGRSDQGGSE